MDKFSASWRALPAPDMGAVIEFTFSGVHHWSHGRRAMEYIDAVLARQSAAALIFNFEAYKYEFGNDLFGVFVSAGFETPTKRLRPVCVVAHGQTEVALKSLLASSNTAGLFDVTFAETPTQLAEWLNHKAVPSA